MTGRVQGKRRRSLELCRAGCTADLRRESAERLVEMDFAGYAIGGLGRRRAPEVTREMIARTLEFLPRDRPRYVMGVGYPTRSRSTRAWAST